MNPNIRWSLKKDAYMELDKDGRSGMLIDINTANHCSCNKNAILILKKLKKGNVNISDLTKEIIKENTVSKSIARKDVSDFVNKLKNMKLIDEKN